MVTFQRDDARRRRTHVRSAVRQLRPLLSSPRLVRLMAEIGWLAVTRPAAVPLVERLVARLHSRPTPARVRELQDGTTERAMKQRA